ncbi:MAG: DUF4214 domain-containing protein, partial [Telluria sp.]
MKRSGLLVQLSVAVLVGTSGSMHAHAAPFSDQYSGIIANNSYAALAQQLYLAFFGRPADPAGLAFYVDALAKSGAPQDLRSLADAYGRDAGIRTLVNGLSGSAEARALYGDDPPRLIAALYRNGFNRDADPEGYAYWLDTIRNQRLDPAAAVLSILAGAQGSDLATFQRKVEASTMFTASVDTPAGRAL